MNIKENNVTQEPRNKPEPLHRKTGFWLSVLGILVIIIIIQHFPFDWFGRKKNGPAIPVVVSTAKKTNVPIYLTELGSVVPVYTVNVKTQVSGQLISVLYKEGQIVKKDDLLAEIDSRPYEAQLVQYEGQLQRDKALLANALIDLNRYQTLWKQDSVSQQTLATQQSLVAQYQGAVQVDEGLIQSTKVNLIYCKITSPIDGRVGLRLVDPGNFVQPSDTTFLMVLNTVNPITVIFTIPEDNVTDVVEQINTGNPLLVEAYDRQNTKLLAKGTLLTIDNQIDQTTGTVKLRAQFNNENNLLFPNQFVNVKFLVKTLPQATVVPTAAVQHGAQGDFVFLVNKDQTVSLKSITTGHTVGNYTVITKGILPLQSVVSEGGDKLVEGSLVVAANQSSNQGQLSS